MKPYTSTTRYTTQCRRPKYDNMQLKKLMPHPRRSEPAAHISFRRLMHIYQPKYIDSLLAAAATRKLDHLRAEEKMMQRERELEGDMYNDKEAFVTQAYKDQMEEVRKAEEEEKKREGQLSSICKVMFYR